MEISSREYPSQPQKGEKKPARGGSAPGAAANWAFNEEWIKRQRDSHYFPYRWGGGGEFCTSEWACFGPQLNHDVSLLNMRLLKEQKMQVVHMLGPARSVSEVNTGARGDKRRSRPDQIVNKRSPLLTRSA